MSRRLFRRRTNWDRIADNAHVIVTVVGVIAAIIGWSMMWSGGATKSPQVASIEADVPVSPQPETPTVIVEQPLPDIAAPAPPPEAPPPPAPAAQPAERPAELALLDSKPLPSDEVELPPEVDAVDIVPAPPPPRLDPPRPRVEPPRRVRQKAPAFVRSQRAVSTQVKSRPVRARAKAPPRRREPVYQPWGLN